MAFENLTEREKEILNNLVNYYISTADPVGSRAIATKFRMGISSATIRNTLQDLEELGLLQQPHTSAGRIPTDLGYRVYVDYLLKPESLTPREKAFIKKSILKEGRGVNEVLGQTCRVLSEITSELGVTIAPRFDRGVLKAINLIPLTSERLMVVVVVRSGLARSVIIEIEANISESSLREFEAVLNERLVGLTLGEIKETVTGRLADVSGHGKLINLIIESKDRIWTEGRAEDVHVAGAEQLVKQPEFSDLRKISEIIKIIEDGRALSDFLDQATEEGLIITIGRENKFQEVMNCSLVTSRYKVGKVSGTIGIIGPTRMAYSKLVSVVEYTARTITEVLSGFDGEEDK
ncbi:MAG: heat-inducible transcription repressor HrcA [Candidatus Zixiibacteriota bacterium]|nr:MAG: heat-inducible transcription repressor HrcA [candidate division Zixibacteria bacterium]